MVFSLAVLGRSRNRAVRGETAIGVICDERLVKRATLFTSPTGNPRGADSLSLIFGKKVLNPMVS